MKKLWKILLGLSISPYIIFTFYTIYKYIDTYIYVQAENITFPYDLGDFYARSVFDMAFIEPFMVLYVFGPLVIPVSMVLFIVCIIHVLIFIRVIFG